GITLDTSGNVYVGGSSFGTGTGYDYVLTKYNNTGAFQWTKVWNGISNSDDYLNTISSASNGDIIVSGSSYNNSSSFDFTTLKYNSSGNLIWTKNYNGPSSADDQVTNMKIDLQNNIYVCGKSVGTGAGYDYATVKYNSAGIQQWVSRYNSTFASDDAATSIDVDLNGNTFVTGNSYRGASFYDYTTIKYNSSGVEQWVRNYNGVENYFDKAFDIKTDGNGNVFVTGQSLKSSDGTGDFVTLKYNSSGDVLWSKTYDGPGQLDDLPVEMKIDKTGSIFIIGSSYSYFFSPLCGTSDYLILKYNSNSNFEWETRYDGAGSGIDEATSLAIDNNGNTYVTGYSFDNISNFDYATIKYNSSGAPQWAIRYDGGSGIDKPSSIFVDTSGSVFVTGSSIGIGIGYEIATVKYNSNAILFWEARFNGTGNGDDFATAMTVDAAGNTYVTGYSDGIGTGKDYVTIKYNPAGVQQWAARYNGPGNAGDFASSVVLDNTGNIYITGKSTGNGSLEDIATIKYNPAGSQVWASRYNGAANNSDEASSIAFDKSGNIIVSGKSKSVSLNYDMITLKYNLSGTQQWAKIHNGTNNSDDEVNSVITDNSGNVFITGSSNNTITNSDFTTIKYNPTGIEQWVSNYNGTLNNTDKASSICIDPAGNIYVSGVSQDIGTNMNYCTIKYNSNGALIWLDKFNHIDNDSDKASVVKVNSEGNVYVTGSSKGIEGGKDFATIKYKQNKVTDMKIFIEGLYNEITNNMIPDTIQVDLRNSSSPYNIIESSSSTIDIQGNGLFFFNSAANNINYYIALNHKNSLETWSASPQSFHSDYLNYDFTNSLSKAYGNNLKPIGNKFCIYSGDVTKDGTIDVTDMSIIDNEIFNFASGYNLADLTGDEIVDINDMSIAENNTFGFVSVIRP
ncbi:MAG: SBBP repeat-containing protein, partial [bacterium]